MKRSTYNLIFAIAIALLLLFTIVGSISYEKFGGVSGKGFTYSFIQDTEAVIGESLLLITLVLYFLLRKKLQ